MIGGGTFGARRLRQNFLNFRELAISGLPSRFFSSSSWFLVSKYPRRLTGLSENPKDFIFRHNGRDVGRCGLRLLSNNERRWSWTIYIGKEVKALIPGVPTAGYASTLDEAKEQFRKSFERMITAGLVD